MEMTLVGDSQRAWRSLPIGTLDEIIGPGECLVLAPHPDDESLGAGGLIAACCDVGRPPLIAILTDGAGSHPHSATFPPRRLRALRAEEARIAVARLGLPPDRIVFLDQPDTAAPREGPTFIALVETIVELVRRKPVCTAIVAPWRHDPHCDHEAASVIADAVAAGAGIRHVAYPVWGWTLPPDTPVPESGGRGWRLDVNAYLPMKRAAIQAHQSQCGGLILDDPTGFQLTPALLSEFDGPFETYLAPA